MVQTNTNKGMHIDYQAEPSEKGTLNAPDVILGEGKGSRMSAAGTQVCFSRTNFCPLQTAYLMQRIQW